MLLVVEEARWEMLDRNRFQKALDATQYEQGHRWHNQLQNLLRMKRTAL
jgi:hypothetical protein